MSAHLIFGRVTLKTMRQPPAPRVRAASSRGLQGGQDLARHEGEGDENGGQDDARRGEHDLVAVSIQPGSKDAPGAEQQDEDQPGDDWRYREGQVDQRDQDVAPGEAVLGKSPRGRHAKDGVERNRDDRRHQGQLDGRHGVRLPQRSKVGTQALFEGLREDRYQRKHDDQEQEQDAEAKQGQAKRQGFGARWAVPARCEQHGRFTRHGMPTCDSTPAGCSWPAG